MPLGLSSDTSAMIGLIYDAALDSTRWSPFLSMLAEAFGGHQATIYRIDSSDSSGNIYAAFGIESKFRESYDGFYSRINPFSPIVAKLNTPTSVTVDDLLDRNIYIQGEFFSDWVKPQGCAEFLTAPLDRSLGVVTGVTVLRGSRPFDGNERARFDLLLPHLRRALAIHGRLHSATIRADGLSAALERTGVGVAIVNNDADVVFANSAAERVFSGRYGLTVRNGRIAVDSPDVQAALMHAIHRAVDVEPVEAPGVVVSVKGQSGVLIPLLVCPVRRDSAALGNGRPLVLIIFGGSQRRITRRHELIDILGLTPAEARLLEALVVGGTLAKYADANALSHETVRSQIRNILIKTGENRQVDVIRRVLDDPVLSRPR